MAKFFLSLTILGYLLPTCCHAQVADTFTRLKLKGFPGCVLKVLNKYPGAILSVEAERTKKLGPKPELFYEFDVELGLDGKIIEIHLRLNPDFRDRDVTSIIPRFEGDIMPHMEGYRYISDPADKRLGFFVK